MMLQTCIAILSTGNPGKTYRYGWKLIQKQGGTIEATFQKGALPPRTFVTQVVEILEHKNLEGRSTSSPKPQEGVDAP